MYCAARSYARAAAGNPTPLPPYQPAAYGESYMYNVLSNLTSKAGIGYAYGAKGNGTGAGLHQVPSMGCWAYSYDASGNLTSGQGKSLPRNAANQPTAITANGVTEGYADDADGQWLVRSANGVTTVSVGGQYEGDLATGTTRTRYQVNN